MIIRGKLRKDNNRILKTRLRIIMAVLKIMIIVLLMMIVNAVYTNDILISINNDKKLVIRNNSHDIYNEKNPE